MNNYVIYPNEFSQYYCTYEYLMILVLKTVSSQSIEKIKMTTMLNNIRQEWAFEESFKFV